MPSEIVVKVLVMALGALWTTRMWRPSSDNTTKEKDSPEPDKSRLSNAANAEPLILKHILDLIQVLMDIGVEEMKEDVELGVGEGDVYDNLAMKITATFRRTLPALRIASKWIKANLEYVLRSAPSTPGTTSTFWSSYASFATTLIQTFPLDGLPSLAAPLEEDIDMKGFAPLKRSMFESGAGAGTGEVHPNEEQLMRIGDLLVDAKFLAQLEVSFMDRRGIYEAYAILFERTLRFISLMGDSPHRLRWNDRLLNSMGTNASSQSLQ
jgi:hypothetical protein